MTEELTRQLLLTMYAERPVREYLQIDVFVNPQDMPDYLRRGLSAKQAAIVAGATDESGCFAISSNACELRESNAPVIVQVRAGTNKEEALAMLSRAYRSVDAAWLEVVSPLQSEQPITKEEERKP